MVQQLSIAKVMPGWQGDGCQLPAKYACNKCGKLVCDVARGLIADEGRATATIRTFGTGHHVVCLFCRFTAQPYVYCTECAGGHEVMLSFRGSCKTAFNALHETSYEDLEYRSNDNATEMRDRREDKYKRMDSLLPEEGGGRLVRSDKEQNEEYDLLD